MEIRRATFGAAVRLGVFLSTVSVLLVLVIDSIGDVNPAAMVATVAAVGFATSWSLTGRTMRTAHVAPRHRVSVVRIHQPVG